MTLATFRNFGYALAHSSCEVVYVETKTPTWGRGSVTEKASGCGDHWRNLPSCTVCGVVLFRLVTVYQASSSFAN